MPNKIPVTKPVSTVGQDRKKDILRAIFIHRELWSKSGYPKKTTIQKKWPLLLNHPSLVQYLENNKGMEYIFIEMIYYYIE